MTWFFVNVFLKFWLKLTTHLPECNFFYYMQITFSNSAIALIGGVFFLT